MRYFFIILSLLVLTSTTSYEATAYLTVKITNIENNKGVLEIGLYNNKNKFPEVGQTFKMVRVKPEGKELEYKFKYLGAGDYAICIYHDKNGDGECNKNWIGIPTESYAFSNNFRPKLSKPSFSDCSFSLKDARMITIRMIN